MVANHGKEGGGWRGIGAKTTCSQKVRNCAGRGWDRVGHHVLLHSARIVLLHSLKERNVLISNFWQLMKPKRMLHSFAFFEKNTRYFEKNAVLFKERAFFLK